MCCVTLFVDCHQVALTVKHSVLHPMSSSDWADPGFDTWSHLNVFVISVSCMADSSVMTFAFNGRHVALTWVSLGSTSGTFALREGRSHRCLFIDIKTWVALHYQLAKPECHSRQEAKHILSPSIFHTAIKKSYCTVCVSVCVYKWTLTCVREMRVSCLNTPFHNQPIKTHNTPTDGGIVKLLLVLLSYLT